MLNRTGVRSEYSRAAVEALIANMLEDSRWPIALVTGELELIWANRAAEEELTSGLSFSLHERRLTLRCEASDDSFRQFLTNCDNKDRPFTHKKGDGDPVLARCRTVRSDHAGAVYAISFFRPSDKPESIEPHLSDLFGLTATEERVLSLLGHGSTADCIADAMGVSIATIRKHISNAYGKIGVRSREELFARLRAYS